MRGPYLTAAVIALLILLWLFSGQVGQTPPPAHPTLAEANQLRAAEAQDTAPTAVRGRVIQASPQIQDVVLRGQTASKRTLTVRAETTGRIVGRPVERGSRVAAGDLLCEVADDDRSASLEEAVQALTQAQIDYAGSLRLQERALLSESGVAQARARVAAAQAQVTRREIDMARTQIRAPFPAIVEDLSVEIGDYVTPGAACVVLVDLNPLRLVARVAERDVHLLQPGQPASGLLSDGRSVAGTLTFVGQQSDPATRTYAVEIEVPNGDLALRSGISARISLPTATVMAHKVSPALFALDDQGNIGIRTADHRNRVEYHPVQILRDDIDGVWVTGLPEVATIITVGQELVVPGQAVEVSFEPGAALPVAAPPSRPAAPPGDADPAAPEEELAAPRDRGAAVTAKPVPASPHGVAAS
jgi:multidrug efflux system membrane fusion protein